MKIFLLSILLVFSYNSFAADSSSGCGLGWAVFKKNSLVSSSLRGTTNALFLNTLAMTSGTSGCAKHSIVKNKFRGIHFANANYHQLLVEMAAGSGEYLEAFSDVLGCENSGSFKSLGQKNYGKIFRNNTKNGAQMYDNLKREVNLANVSCKLI